MSPEHSETKLGLELKWMLASILGVTLGLAISLNAAWILHAGGSLMYSELSMTKFASGAILGVSVGVMQWLVLRRFISKAGAWILASTMGAAVGFFASGALGFRLFYDLDFSMGFELPSWEIGGTNSYTLGTPIAGGVIGAFIGIGQWLVLRRKVSQAAWWMPASAVGLALGWAAGSSVAQFGLIFGLIALLPHWLAVTITGRLSALEVDLMSIDKLLAAGVSTGLVYGLVTGIALAWLLTRATPVARRPTLSSKKRMNDA